MPAPQDRTLATVIEYEQLIAAVRARMHEIGVTNETMDAITGLPSGYTGKLIAANGTKSMGKISFGTIIQGLGLKLIVVEDSAATEKMRPRWRQREKIVPDKVLAFASTRRATWLFTSRSGRKAARARAEKLSPDERQAIGRNAISTRWARHREKQRLREAARQQAGAHA
jgi:hypothetical protein